MIKQTDFWRPLRAWLLCCLLLPALAHADTPAWLQDKLPQARLVGKGEMSWLLLPLYEAQLFAPNGQVQSGEPYALRLIYARSIDSADIVEASVKEIRRLTGAPASLAQWEAAMRQIFPDVRDDDEITGVFTPDGPTRFFQRGRLLGEVRDPQFGPAFFGIWLNPRTREPALRRSLLGLER